MKVRSNEANLVSRRWSNNGRICDYHVGSSWLRRLTNDNPQKRRSKGDALGFDQVSAYRSELGSVTAEFALVLPAVLLILAFSLSALSMQTNRMALIELSAEGARAVARGEPESVVDDLMQNRRLVPSPQVKWSFSEFSVCLELGQNIQLPIFGNFLAIPVLERQCARKSGL